MQLETIFSLFSNLPPSFRLLNMKSNFNLRQVKGELSILAVTAALGGCAADGTINLGALTQQQNTQVQPQQQKATPPQTQATERQAVANVVPPELEGLFTKFPIKNSNRPESWPRVAITITKAAPRVFNLMHSYGSEYKVKEDDCITYDIKVWYSAKDAKKYTNLSMCAGELYQRIKGIPLYQLPLWGKRIAFPSEKNTGTVRTEGPDFPYEHFPTDPVSRINWLDGGKTATAYLGGIFVTLGYDWNNLLDRRIWVVSAVNK